MVDGFCVVEGTGLLSPSPDKFICYNILIMARSNAGALRHARAIVAPQIPELGVRLRTDRRAIHRAVVSSLVAIDVDPEQFAEADINKTKRHAIAGYFIGRQQKLLVEGSERDARFTDFASTPQGRKQYDMCQQFSIDTRETLKHGAQAVQRSYTKGDDPEHRTWPRLARYYQWLGLSAAWLARQDGFKFNQSIPFEGISLPHALRTNALGSTVVSYINLVNREVDKPDDRLVAAHDLAYLVMTGSGTHALEFGMSSAYSKLITGIELGEKGRYQLDRPRPGYWEAVYPRIDALPNVTLKCAAGAEDQGTLRAFVHADINAAAERGLFLLNSSELSVNGPFM